MPTDMPPRGPLTDQLVTLLALDDGLDTAGIVAGDHTRPPEAGWSGTQPGQGQFIASVEVATGEATPHFRETVRSRHTSWQMTYHLRVIGATRSQADHAADKVREACLAFPQGEYAPGWKVIAVVIPRQAPIRKENPTDHPTFAVDDVVQLWVERA